MKSERLPAYPPFIERQTTRPNKLVPPAIQHASSQGCVPREAQPTHYCCYTTIILLLLLLLCRLGFGLAGYSSRYTINHVAMHYTRYVAYAVMVSGYIFPVESTE